MFVYYWSEGFAVPCGFVIEVAFEVEDYRALFPCKKLGRSPAILCLPRWGFDQDITKFRPLWGCANMQDAENNRVLSQILLRRS